MLVIGVDPGSITMGYAVLRKHDRVKDPMDLISAGVLHAPQSWRVSRRLLHLGTGLEAVVDEIDTEADVVLCGIEAGFVNGQQGALASGASRGLAMYILAKRFRVDVREYQTSTCKLAATGNGAAKKTDVARAVTARLHLATTPDADIADAIAVAIARAQDPKPSL